MNWDEGKGPRPADPYQRIIWAAKRGVGCNLSAEECRDMFFDNMISTRAYVQAGMQGCRDADES